MQLTVLTTLITEPITHDDVKTFMGFPSTDTSQDDVIDRMITASREWLEQRTALSIVSKSYKAYFEQYENEEGWFELPISPILDTPAITIKMSGISTTFQKKGLKRVSIRPDSVIGTMLVGVTEDSYMEVTFQAGETNLTANEILLELVNMNFNHKDSGIGVAFSRLPYDVQSKVNSLSMNLC